jgi:uncharacterized protein
MAYIFIPLAACVISGLTLISGFGLGTLLLPVFAASFPLPLAIAATAVVHLSNNLYKLILVGKNADRQVLVRFALPAAAAALTGALFLNEVQKLPVIFSYPAFGRFMHVTALNLMIGALLIGFSLSEFFPGLIRMRMNRKFLAAGGLLSGFFGGVSGMQGAFRAAFLANSGLSKEAFIGTSVASAVIVDVSRSLVYGINLRAAHFYSLTGKMALLVLITMVSAFFGAWYANRQSMKMTLPTVKTIVGILLSLSGLAMAAGLL